MFARVRHHALPFSMIAVQRVYNAGEWCGRVTDGRCIPTLPGGGRGRWGVDAVLPCVFLFGAKDVAALEQTTVFLSLRVLLPHSVVIGSLACSAITTRLLQWSNIIYRLLRHDKMGETRSALLTPRSVWMTQQYVCTIHRTCEI